MCNVKVNPDVRNRHQNEAARELTPLAEDEDIQMTKGNQFSHCTGQLANCEINSRRTVSAYQFAVCV